MVVTVDSRTCDFPASQSVRAKLEGTESFVK